MTRKFFIVLSMDFELEKKTNRKERQGGKSFHGSSNVTNGFDETKTGC